MDQGKRVGWLVWIYYQDPIPDDEDRGLTFGTSGFTVRVYVDDNLVLDSKTKEGADTHIAQTKGFNDDYSIQFFVSTEDYEKEGQTPSHEIRIEVTGLISINHKATFTLPDMLTPGETTLQTDPLEGRNRGD